jgi:Trypsin-like peptidase domain
MDFRQFFSDPAMTREFLDRFDEIRAGLRGEADGLEGLEGGGGPTRQRASDAVESMAEGTWESQDPGLEAIIRRFTRPVYLVQQSTFQPPADGFPNSKEIGSRLERARTRIENAIPSTGRIDVRNHRLSWVGTAWMVGPTVAVTNRHVAEEFARMEVGAFTFRRTFGGRVVRATVDWRHEYLQPEESRFQVEEVLWIEPDISADVALLRLAKQGDDGEALPPAIELMSQEELQAAAVGGWMAVIGYPAPDRRNDAEDQQRIFNGIYGVKRIAAGRLTAIAPDGVVHHDATTLGGNSGSVVLDMATGKAAALHFGGIEGERNLAVQAPIIAGLLEQHASVEVGADG